MSGFRWDIHAFSFRVESHFHLLNMSIKIAFIHPDLGIGGAERLVVDAAVGLQGDGNTVSIYTSHCDKTHCFEEVSSGVLNVHVHGDFLPVSILGKFHVLCAIFRQLYLVMYLIWTGEVQEYDYFIVDQLSFCIPFLSFFGKKASRILFYCHFPDLLLSKKTSFAKSLYRKPFDAIEEWTTGVSDNIVVNSNFTKSVFHRTFSSLSSFEPGVIYPCVDTKACEVDNSACENEFLEFMDGNPYFLSINRFERLKNIELAINSYAKALPEIKGKQPILIVAGGYDARVRENLEYLQELEQLCNLLSLIHYVFRGKLVLKPKSTQVIFMPSVKTSIKNAALNNAELLLYTPTFEHFGIVPVESMLHKTPVLAINRGGPLESIVSYNGKNLDVATGYNRLNDVDEWASVIKQHMIDSDEKTRVLLGENGFKRVNQLFSRETMTKSFEAQLQVCKNSKRNKGTIYKFFELWQIWVGALLLIIVAVNFQ